MEHLMGIIKTLQYTSYIKIKLRKNTFKINKLRELKG